MSFAISPSDHRAEQARALAAEQQAVRAMRAQQAQQNLQFQEPSAFAPRPSEVQEFSRQGLIGSRRLGRHLEGMLRDKPKFNFPESNGPGPRPETAVATATAAPEFVPYVPGSPPTELPLFNPRPPRAAEDPGSRDLNLSPQNRLNALTQGLPATATGRAALQLFV